MYCHGVVPYRADGGEVAARPRLADVCRVVDPRAIARQYHCRGAKLIRLWPRHTRRLRTLLAQCPSRIHQATPRANNARVTAAQMLRRPIADPAHTLLTGRILRPDTR